MDSKYSQELRLAFQALQYAAKISRAVISSEDKGIIEKEDLTPVTVADFAVQALLVATFKHAFPHDTFVGEENASQLRANPVLLDRVWELLQRILGSDASQESDCRIPSSKLELCDLVDQCGASAPGGAGSGRTWVFDPIDGTKTYMLGQVYAINVALLVDGKQTVSAVGCPNTSSSATAPLTNADVDSTDGGCIVYAVRGHGAFTRPMDGSIDEMQPRKLAPVVSGADTDMDIKQARFVTSNTIVDSALDGIHEAIAERMGVPYPGCDLLPWVLRWAMLAMGLGNVTIWVYKRKHRHGKVWDHAGAMLLFEETGGVITDVRGKPIDLTVGRKMTANFGFVAAPRELHAAVLAQVHDVLREHGRGDLLE